MIAAELAYHTDEIRQFEAILDMYIGPLSMHLLAVLSIENETKRLSCVAERWERPETRP